MNGISRVPYVEIVYEPSPVYRMRYEAENRSTYLVAENYVPDRENTSSAKNRKKQQVSEGLYPRVKVVDGEGPATLIVFCVNKTEPYHVHPHKLVGPNCKHGVAVFNIDKKQNIFDLIGVSIQFTKKSDIEKRIQELKEKNFDPFNVGFDFDRQSIDLTSVRLCFQIFLRDSFDTTEIIRDKYHILKPVVSQVISNSFCQNTLSIISAFNPSSSCNGGSDVGIHIKQLKKNQKPLKVKFYDSSGWSSIVDIEDSKIHYQCAFNFKAPQYPKKIDKEKTVFFKLFIPSKTGEENQNESEEIEFVYMPSKTMPPNSADVSHNNEIAGQENLENGRSNLNPDFFNFIDIPFNDFAAEVSEAFDQENLENGRSNLDPDFFNFIDIPFNDFVAEISEAIDQENLENGRSNFDPDIFNILENKPITTHL